MQMSNRDGHAATASEPLPKCAICRDPVLPAAGAPRGSICKLCASELEELGWRTVYDRERSIGQIPANLRAAYKL